jgi:uncharacterized DUF497 family protein
MRVFEWNAAKAASNIRKHRLAFESVVAVFDDPLVQIEQDRIVDGEQRWQATGLANGYILVVVAYATWDDEQGTEIIRIISARRAEKHERKRYQG